MQKILDNVLIEGLINHDKRNGWRGVIDNYDYLISEIENKTKIVNPHPNKWKISQIVSIDNKSLSISIVDNPLIGK